MYKHHYWWGNQNFTTGKAFVFCEQGDVSGKGSYISYNLLWHLCFCTVVKSRSNHKLAPLGMTIPSGVTAPLRTMHLGLTAPLGMTVPFRVTAPLVRKVQLGVTAPLAVWILALRYGSLKSSLMWLCTSWPYFILVLHTACDITLTL